MARDCKGGKGSVNSAEQPESEGGLGLGGGDETDRQRKGEDKQSHGLAQHDEWNYEGTDYEYYGGEWGGETVIKLDDEWKKVYPKPGRVFLFKGKIPHHGNPPNEMYKGLRATLVYKTMRAKPLPAAQPWRT